jgi:hypothetical protein
MPTAELTLRLPVEEVEFLKAYAQEHGTTAAELLAGYVRRLQANGHKPLHPDVVGITGLVPPDSDVKAEYRQHLLDKHK